MVKLRCKRGTDSPYSPDVAIGDFYLFSCPKDKVAGFHADDDAELLRKVQEILTSIDRTEVKNSFGHWIERCQWVATDTDEYNPEE
jgi:hypothetical protein